MNITNQVSKRKGPPRKARSILSGPKKGMGVTLCFWTDRKAATITNVTAMTIYVQEDAAIRVDKNGISESQTYTYKRDPDGITYRFRLGKDGQWKVLDAKVSKCGIILGRRDAYHDFSF